MRFFRLSLATLVLVVTPGATGFAQRSSVSLELGFRDPPASAVTVLAFKED